MLVDITWQDVALRLALTLLAGALIGINREEGGHSAGLRTSMLVCLAASLSMIQVNLLLGMSGKTPSSFAVMDLMRLPLGILSGMGFIGAGAILRKETVVAGVTTAATLWFATVMGLCFGGGQIGLGIAALVAGIGILWGLKAVEKWLHKSLEGMLTLKVQGKNFPHDEIDAKIAASIGQIGSWTECVIDTETGTRKQTCLVHMKKGSAAKIPDFVESIANANGVINVQWKIVGQGSS